MRLRSTLLISAAIWVTAISCGGTELEVDPTFDGVWTVTRLTVDSTEITTDQSVLVIEIDTAELALRGRTGCGRLFGSYTLSKAEGLDREGPASFTIPSRAPDDSCPTDDRVRHDALVVGLESVSRWRREGSLLVLGDQTTLVELRPGG